MKAKFKSLVLAGAALGCLNTGLIAEATVSLKNNWGTTMSPYPGSPKVQITGYDGVTYEVPLAQKFNNTDATEKIYKYYVKKSRNVLFRQNYGWATTYQPIPSGAVRSAGVDNYSWDTLYESNPKNAPYEFNNKFFEENSVVVNTVNCGYSEGAPIACIGTNNLNPGGLKGHTYYESGIREDGTFGRIGLFGETRFIGYSALGNVVDNSYYVMDNRVDFDLGTYPYDADVFNLTYKKVEKTRYDGKDYRYLKIDAIKRLLTDYPEMKKISSDPNYWVNRLSLQTNPITEAPVFLATRKDGKGYQAIFLEPSASATMNVGIISMKIYDTNENLLAGVTRDKVGGDNLTVSFDGQELSKRPKLEPGETYRVEIQVQNGSKAATKITSQQLVMNEENYSHCGSLDAGEICTFNIDYTAPKEGDQTVELFATLSDAYYETGDNLDPVDDEMELQIMVNKPPKGDVALTNVYLVEAKTNKVVDHPIQGVEYYLQFKGTYIGESMKGNNLAFKVKADITTSVPQNGGGTAESTKTYYTNEIVTTLPASSKDEPKTFEFKTKTFKATSSTIKVDGTLIGPSKFDWTYNTNDKNDKVNKTWTAPINLTLSQVTLDPGSHPGGDYCGTVTVNYWVDFTLAYNMTNRPAEVQKVQVAFYANGNYVTSDTIKVYAKQGKRQYTFQLNLNGNCVKPGDDIKVIVNPTHKLSESTMSDNSKTVDWNSKYPEGYCENKTNQTRLKWTQKYLNLSLIENGYGVNVDQVDEKEFILLDDNYEQVTIRKIEMRSKLMTDKKMGPNQDGWVDALNPGKDKIQIKAGYGFDIRITVEYVTNAYQNEKTNPKLKDIPISQLHTPLKPVLLTQNLFINLPSSQQPPISLYSNDIKLETTGPVHETVPGILDNYHWTYTIAERLSPNGTNQMVDSLFINENTKDGEYTIKVYTSPIFGVPGKTPKSKDSDGNFIQYDPLCASKEIKFEVKGSVYDDLEIGLIK